MDEHHLRARIPKCHFLQSTVDYLGFIVGNDMIQPGPKKTASIASWPLPKDIHDLRSFLGMTNTLLRFIPNYADKTAFLSDKLKGLTSKNPTLQWTPSDISLFEDLKVMLMKEPVTSHIFDPTKILYLYTDWSKNALGGWISQEID